MSNPREVGIVYGYIKALVEGTNMTFDEGLTAGEALTHIMVGFGKEKVNEGLEKAASIAREYKADALVGLYAQQEMIAQTIEEERYGQDERPVNLV